MGKGHHKHHGHKHHGHKHHDHDHHHKKWHGGEELSEPDKKLVEDYGLRKKDLAIFKALKGVIEQDTNANEFKNNVIEGLKNDLTSIHDTVVHKFHEMVAIGEVQGAAALAADSILYSIVNTFEHNHPDLLNETATFKVDGGFADKLETFAEYLHDDFLVLE